MLNELNKGIIRISDLDHFNTTVPKILDNEAPIKMKNIRANEAPFMNRTIKKAIMKRSRLRNKFLKNPTDENNLNYKRQRNLCVTLLRNEKRIFFEHIDTKKISDNKTFWKTVKPFISNKCRSSENKGDDTVSDKGQVANIFNEFFAIVVKNLNITINEDILSDTKA